jgi:hypothetical protein
METEAAFRKLAKDLQVEILGSYNPKTAGCNSSEFYDGMHPKESCMRKIVSPR